MTPIPLGILDFPTAAGAYDLLETQILTSSAASVTFTGLGSYSDYKHLQIRAVARSDAGIDATFNTTLRFNGDSGSNYSYHYLGVESLSSPFSSNASSRTSILLNDWLPLGNTTANVFGALVMDVLDFANTNKYKTIRRFSGVAGITQPDLMFSSGLWQSNVAISSFVIASSAGNFVAGSRFSLYGVR